MKCSQCDKKFPDELISPMTLNGRQFQTCPICALSIRNEAHNLPVGTLFQGGTAKQMYEEAVEHVKRTGGTNANA